jgi:hypothetical protein
MFVRRRLRSQNHRVRVVDLIADVIDQRQMKQLTPCDCDNENKKCCMRKGEKANRNQQSIVQQQTRKHTQPTSIAEEYRESRAVDHAKA